MFAAWEVATADDKVIQFPFYGIHLCGQILITLTVGPSINHHNLLLLLCWKQRWIDGKWKPTKRKIEFIWKNQLWTVPLLRGGWVKAFQKKIIQKLLSTLLDWIKPIQNSITEKKKKRLEKNNSRRQWRKCHNHILEKCQIEKNGSEKLSENQIECFQRRPSMSIGCLRTP